MLFDVKAALADIMPGQTLVATPATNPAGAGPVSQVSRESLGYPAESTPKAFLLDGKAKMILLSAGHPKNTSMPTVPAGLDCYPHGHAPNGYPRTWTGRTVSLDEWRGLSDRDRHGSTGKLWNGLTRLWEPETTEDKAALSGAYFQGLGTSMAPNLQEG